MENRKPILIFRVPPEIKGSIPEYLNKEYHVLTLTEHGRDVIDLEILSENKPRGLGLFYMRKIYKLLKNQLKGSIVWKVT